MITGFENHFLVFLRVAVLHRFHCTINHPIYIVSNQMEEFISIQRVNYFYSSQRIVKIKHTNHPNFSVRSVVMSRDCSVRIISPVTGDVITTLLLNPSRGLVDVAYAIEEGRHVEATTS